MQDLPHTHDLIDAICEFLGDRIAPQLSGHYGFHMRVSINLLRMIQRANALAPGFEVDERARIQTLLQSDEADLETLNRALCDAIREQRLTIDNADLRAHLMQTTLDKLAIDQPRYRALSF